MAALDRALDHAIDEDDTVWALLRDHGLGDGSLDDAMNEVRRRLTAPAEPTEEGAAVAPPLQATQGYGLTQEDEEDEDDDDVVRKAADGSKTAAKAGAGAEGSDDEDEEELAGATVVDDTAEAPAGDQDEVAVVPAVAASKAVAAKAAKAEAAAKAAANAEAEAEKEAQTAAEAEAKAAEAKAKSLSQDGGPGSGSATGGKREVHKNVRVGFSGFDNPDLRNKLTKIVKALKGSVEESKDAGAVLGCTHLVVDTAPPGGLKRTAKLCVAISRPLVRIVQAKWLAACEMAGTFVSAEPYLLEGEHAKDNWSFNATTSRKAAAEGSGCLHGVAFVVTNETKPSQADLKAIILAAGGEVLEKPPSGAKGNKGVVVVSTADEVRTWQKLASLPSVRCVLRADHVLTCVLKQALDTSNGRLEA
ncbi:pax-interacting protein 1-like protein [Chrysochromulina tobinii]|uniref:Pax-interacting protein 1-like protein n=1 Tax=Chrysochromulina tobinii TaxID=1460289 RepID=A0A0M0JVF9_9EUKA|nr:pax-interacting protein 1-like protein [Chrysochromulina tobinii]|eukprot:KOO30509.1 pax-interacting protein 1-like protein [Chrysochromulina sp. CCMP291]